MSAKYIEFLKEQKKKYQDWVMCPSKFEPEPKEPLCMSRQTKVFRAGGSVGGRGEFGNGTHTAWEEFQSTISQTKYQSVVSGTMFPKRRAFGESDDQWQTALDKAEEKRRPKSLFRQTAY